MIFEGGVAIGLICPRQPGVLQRFYPEAALPPPRPPRVRRSRASPAKPRFTAKQGQVLAFVHLYTKLNRRPPAEADVARYFEVSGPSAHQMIVNLEKHGLIERVPGMARTMRVLLDPSELPPLK